MDDSITIESRGGDILYTDNGSVGTSPPNSFGLTGTKRATKGAKADAKKEIRFPLFEQIAEMQTNDAWKALFMKMAIAKFPPKMIFIEDRNYSKDSLDPDMKVGVLNYKIRKTEKSLPVNNEPMIMSEEIKAFIKSNTSLEFDDSESDEDDMPITFVSEQKTHWNRLKANDRASRLEIFAAKYAKEKGLTSVQQKNLETDLMLANMSKGLTESRVEMNDSGDIVKISGLRMLENGMFIIGNG